MPGTASPSNAASTSKPAAPGGAPCCWVASETMAGRARLQSRVFGLRAKDRTTGVARRQQKRAGFRRPLRLRLRYAKGSSRRTAQILVGRGERSTGAFDLRRHAVRDLADRKRDVAAAQANIGQFAVAHAEELGLGGAQFEIRLDPGNQTVPLSAQPQGPNPDGVGHQLGARMTRALVAPAALLLV